MPGPGKASCNSFYMFMLNYKAREERKGVRFEKGMESVVQPAGEEWRRMSAEQKAHYKEKAREYRSSAEFRAKKRRNWNQTPKPKTANQEKLKQQMLKNPSDTDDEEFLDDAESIFFDQEEEGRLNRKRERQREDFKRALTWNLGAEFDRNILMESFLIMSVQNYYETPEHQYSPCEIAFVEFSLTRGITKQYHAILKPMYIPQNLKNRVISHASSTHHIMPADGRLPPESRDDYRVVVNEIKKFYINKSYYRVFVLLDQLNSVQGAAKAMRDKVSSKQFVPSDAIMCVEDLLTLLCSFRDTVPKLSDFDGFSKILDGCGWDSDFHCVCSFHNRVQSKYCALGTAKKTIFYLLTRLKDVFQLNNPSHIPLSIQQLEFDVPVLEDQLLDLTDQPENNHDYGNDQPETSHNYNYDDIYEGDRSVQRPGDVHNAQNMYPTELPPNFDDDDEDFLSVSAHMALSNENFRNEMAAMTSSAAAMTASTAMTSSEAVAGPSASEFDFFTRYCQKPPEGVAGVRWQKGPYDYDQAQYDAQVQLQYDAQLQQEKKRVSRALFQNLNDSSFDADNGYTNNKFVLTYSNAYVPDGPEPPGFARASRRYQRSGSNVSTDDNLQSTTDAMASLNVSYHNNVPQPAPYLPIPPPAPYSSGNMLNTSSGRLPNSKALCSRFLLAPVPNNPQQN